MSTKLANIDPEIAALVDGLLMKVNERGLASLGILRTVADAGVIQTLTFKRAGNGLSVTSTQLGLLRKAEVAAQLGVSVWTVENWVKRGRFPPPIYLQPGSPATWRVKDIEAFLEKCRRARRPKRSARGAIKQRLEPAR